MEYISPVLVCRGKQFTWGERTYVMGVINVTPDSFSGDGMMDVQAAVDQGKRFVEEGAHILDVGGQSTRPAYAVGIESGLSSTGESRMAALVSEKEEARRIVPVVSRLAKEMDVPISVDTYTSEVARQALEVGASMINDVWGLKADPNLAIVAAEHNAPLILMHNQHEVQYENLMAEILASLEISVRQAMDVGVLAQKIILDPGFGFGKMPVQNLEVLRHLKELKALGYPLLVGTSRKSTIGLVLDLPVHERLEGTAATVAMAIANGADMVRVHDVKVMARVALMTDAIVRGWEPGLKE